MAALPKMQAWHKGEDPRDGTYAVCAGAWGQPWYSLYIYREEMGRRMLFAGKAM